MGRAEAFAIEPPLPSFIDGIGNGWLLSDLDAVGFLRLFGAGSVRRGSIGKSHRRRLVLHQRHDVAPPSAFFIIGITMGDSCAS